MKAMTKVFALGALGAGIYGVVRAVRRGAVRNQQRDLESFDFGDLEEPVVITEEVVVVSEAGPYEIDMEMIPAEGSQQDQNVESAETGRDVPR